MKKCFLAAAVVVFVVSVVSTGFASSLRLKGGLSYNSLISETNEIGDGYDETKGGIGAYGQVLFGYFNMKYGIEVSYLPIYKLTYSASQNYGGYVITSELDAKLTSIPVLGIFQYEFDRGSQTTPYVNLLGGIIMSQSSVKTTVSVNPPIMPDDTTDISESGSDFAIGIGGGMSVNISERIDLDFSARYLSISSGSSDDEDDEDDDSMEMINFLFGIKFR